MVPERPGRELAPHETFDHDEVAGRGVSWPPVLTAHRKLLRS